MEKRPACLYSIRILSNEGELLIPGTIDWCCIIINWGIDAGIRIECGSNSILNKTALYYDNETRT